MLTSYFPLPIRIETSPTLNIPTKHKTSSISEKNVSNKQIKYHVMLDCKFIPFNIPGVNKRKFVTFIIFIIT